MLEQKRSYIGGNVLLDMLTAAESEESSALLASAAVVDFECGDILLDTNEVIEHVYFPIDMMVSTTTLMHFGSEVEVDSIGREGMAGAQIILGAHRVPGKTTCQVPGSGARITAQRFSQHIERSAESSSSLRRYIQATMNFLEISIACNALHAAGSRCARWLLIAHDRVRRDEFGLPQEFLGNMLGVKRSTAASVAQKLQDRGAVCYDRGRMQILDRALLEDASCECYKLGVKRYNELLSQAKVVRASGSHLALAPGPTSDLGWDVATRAGA